MIRKRTGAGKRGLAALRRLVHRHDRPALVVVDALAVVQDRGHSMCVSYPGPILRLQVYGFIERSRRALLVAVIDIPQRTVTWVDHLLTTG